MSINLNYLLERVNLCMVFTQVTIVKGDASDDGVVSSLCQKALDEEGRLDVYYANGAICTWKPLVDTSFEDFMSTIKINSGS